MLEYNIDPHLPCFLIGTISIKGQFSLLPTGVGLRLQPMRVLTQARLFKSWPRIHCLQCNKVEHAFGIAREWIDPVGRSAVFFYPFLCQSGLLVDVPREDIKQLATGQFHWSWVRWLEPVARDGFCTDCGSTCVSCPVNQRAFPVVSLCELGCLFPVLHEDEASSEQNRTCE